MATEQLGLEDIMATRSKRHKRDTATYRGLKNYSERVKSFNATARNLGEYTRVQLESDISNRRSRKAIANARVKTLHKVIDRINRMA